VVPIGRGAIDLTPTKHAFWMWVAALLLIAIFWVNRPKKGQLVPRGIGALLEVVVLFVRDEIARKNIGGKEAERYTPFLLSCFFFIFMMNVLGLLPYVSTPTGNIGVTLGLSLLTFLLTQSAGIRAAGLGGYLKHLTGGVHPLLWPIMIPVEFLGLFTKPFALTMRLFANMAAGHIIIFFLLGLIFVMNSLALAPVSVAFAFGIYLLEILVALIQAYVFTMLSALFIGFGAAMGEHAEHGEVEAADPPGQLGGREAPIP
jgi:F-type H+-transporting ATPase subunit a